MITLNIEIKHNSIGRIEAHVTAPPQLNTEEEQAALAEIMDIIEHSEELIGAGPKVHRLDSNN